MAFAKFEENRFRIDREIAENHAILVNLTASIGLLVLGYILGYYIRHLTIKYNLTLLFTLLE